MDGAGNSTVFWTVFSGVLTYLIGQLVLKLVIEPVQEMRKIIGTVAHGLIEWSNIYMNPGLTTEEAMRTASNGFRVLSSQLQSQMYVVPCYAGIVGWCFKLPSRENVLEASGALIGLSNSVFSPGAQGKVVDHNLKRAQRVRDCLGIYTSPEDRSENM